MFKIIKFFDDTTIRSNILYASENKDEILEINDINKFNYIEKSKILFCIDKKNIIDLIENNYQEAYISLYVASLNNILSSDYIIIKELLDDYEIGLNGTYFDLNYNSGVSWKYKSISNQLLWNNLGGDENDSNYIEYFLKNIDDNGLIYINITDFLKKAYYNSENKNFISFSISLNNSNFITKNKIIKIFSIESNTINYPKIILYKDSYIFEENNNIKEANPIKSNISIINFKNRYYCNSVELFQLYINDNIEFKHGQNVDYFENKKIRHIEYSIIDELTKSIVIPFSNYTRISHNNQYGNHFFVDFTNFESRYYRIIFKLYYNNNNSKIIDNKYIFKIVK